MRGGRRDNDRGETLIELLVAIAIMGIAVVTIIGATATAIHLSDIHREQAKAGAFLREFAERIEGQVAAPTTGYKLCAVAGDYSGPSVYTPADTSFNATATNVQVWGVSGGWLPSGAGCTGDHGVQRVSLQVTHPADNVTEKLDIVIRRPCRPADALCGP
jgi:type II secretory pathway pseudopilin PulG